MAARPPSFGLIEKNMLHLFSLDIRWWRFFLYLSLVKKYFLPHERPNSKQSKVYEKKILWLTKYYAIYLKYFAKMRAFSKQSNNIVCSQCQIYQTAILFAPSKIGSVKRPWSFLIFRDQIKKKIKNIFSKEWECKK